uniref:KRAB domain-containing protein n=1 Tax=Anolis carolinensis TaxID=28377 RepID=A0A803SYI4_ANOCA
MCTVCIFCVLKNKYSGRGGGKAAKEAETTTLRDDCFLGSVDFELAVHFTEGEWALVDPNQRALYKEVLQENYRDGSSLVHVKKILESSWEQV